MTLPVVFTANGPTGYNLTNSLRFRGSASAYLNRTPASASNRKTWTWSGWVKIGKAASTGLFTASTSASNMYTIQLGSDGTLNVYAYAGTYTYFRVTSAVFRDYSAWYHFVVAFDSTQATDTNRIKIYVNSVLQSTTSGSGSGWPTLNYDGGVNNTINHQFSDNVGGASYFDGYLTEVNFIDGQALTPSSFGSTNALTGVWQPAKYTGTYGTNGFYLPFTDNSALTTSSNVGLGKDFSGNGNYFTTNNISITAGTTYDSMTDVPTLTSATQANYCVLNPLDSYATAISNANLKFADGSGNAYQAYSTMANPNIAIYKFYCEITVDAGYLVGIVPETQSAANGSTDRTNLLGYYSNGNKYNGTSASAYGASFTSGDVIGIAVGNGQLEFYKNNVSQGVAFSSLTGAYKFAVWAAGSAGIGCSFNFGQQPFSYTPPTGFVALNTFNLPSSTIVAGNKQMDATTYTGTGASLSVVNAGGFQPDFVWTKPRSTAVGHTLFDSIRGVTNYLQSNTTGAEGTAATSLTAFNTNGFTVNSDTSTGANGVTYVGWQWKAGGTAVTNTAGTISSQVSANTTSGFSIVTYTGNGTSGATVGHGLGVAPSVIFAKVRSRSGDSWHSYHSALGGTQGILLNATNAASTDSGFWNNTNPSSTVITLGTYNTFSSQTYVAYCFAQVAGYSAFGSYTGNGSTDGTFVFTGFRPRWILIKVSSGGTGSWILYDTARNTYNVSQNILYPNLSDAEATTSSANLDILSNGFKLRTSNADFNGSTFTYIYACFAENPFKYANAR